MQCYIECYYDSSSCVLYLHLVSVFDAAMFCQLCKRTEQCLSQMVRKTGFYKHCHENGVCVYVCMSMCDCIHVNNKYLYECVCTKCIAYFYLFYSFACCMFYPKLGGERANTEEKAPQKRNDN